MRLFTKFLLDAFRLLCIFPDIGDSSHKTVDIKKQKIFILFDFLQSSATSFKDRMIIFSKVSCRCFSYCIQADLEGILFELSS